MTAEPGRNCTDGVEDAAELTRRFRDTGVPIQLEAQRFLQFWRPDRRKPRRLLGKSGPGRQTVDILHLQTSVSDCRQASLHGEIQTATPESPTHRRLGTARNRCHLLTNDHTDTFIGSNNGR